MLKTNYEELGTIGLRLVGILIIIASIVGYIMNITSIVHTINNPMTGMFFFRCIGILAVPLGCILGYF